MTNEELDANFARLSDAIKRDDDKAAAEAVFVLVKDVITSLSRIAAAIERIGCSAPAK